MNLYRSFVTELQHFYSISEKIEKHLRAEKWERK